MLQVLQNLKTGEIQVANVPWPKVQRGHLLIATHRTLISAGTERMMLDFGKANWVNKARQQPDKVRMVLDKVKTDGLMPTLQAVQDKLDQPLSLGYCQYGVVVEVGEGVIGFEKGDRVISNGPHAEVVSSPAILCAKVPHNVSGEDAAFTVLGSIALQGIRLVNPTLGEVVVVTGLGLIGLMTVQLLRAHGCRVLGIDFDSEKLILARQFGAETVDLSKDEDPIKAAEVFSRGRGVDAVIITAATSSSEPMHQAANMCRKKGRIVLVGVTGLELSRTEFFKKELSFQVSCSYGPGRYDSNYEEKGHDYPVPYVRWTEQRNFEAVLDMMSAQALNVQPLISHRFTIESADTAYDLLTSGEKSLGVLLEYKGLENSEPVRRVQVGTPAKSIKGSSDQPRIGFIGSGNYAMRTLIPAFKEAGAQLVATVSNRGVSGVHAAKKFDFEATTTDAETLYSDPAVNLLVIATRHNSHASIIEKALTARKHVFVEKPLALTLQEVDAIKRAYEKAGETLLLTVGFNRRFAPHILKAKELLQTTSGPRLIILTINSGDIPADHWAQSLSEGGRRLIGEGCHFIDLARDLAGSPIVAFQVASLDPQGSQNREDRFTLTLKFENGSMATVHYFSNGHKGFPKERVEIFCDGKAIEIDNFRKMTAYGFKGFKKFNLWSQDKGQKTLAHRVIQAVKGIAGAPIHMSEIFEVAEVTIKVAEHLRQTEKV